MLFVTGLTVSSAPLWTCTGSFTTHWCAHGSRVRVYVCQQLDSVCVWRFAVGWWLPDGRLFVLPATACRMASWQAVHP